MFSPLSYDRLAEPALLRPNQKPAGEVELDRNHWAYSHCRFAYCSSNKLRQNLYRGTKIDWLGAYNGVTDQNNISISGTSTATTHAAGESFGDSTYRITDLGSVSTRWTAVMQFYAKAGHGDGLRIGLLSTQSAYSSGNGFFARVGTTANTINLHARFNSQLYATGTLDQSISDGTGVMTFILRWDGLNAAVFEPNTKHSGTFTTDTIQGDDNQGIVWGHGWDTAAENKVLNADWYTAQLYRAALTDAQCWSLVRNPYQVFRPATRLVFPQASAGGDITIPVDPGGTPY